MPIESGDSWFSPKCIEVQPGSKRARGGRALLSCGGVTAYQRTANCECPQHAPGVRRPLPWVSFGTLLVIAGWVAMSLGFWVYLTKVADYNSIFGHLANLVVLMAYLYAAAVVFLAGPQVDAIVRRETQLRSR